jgi:hypothetical protein
MENWIGLLVIMTLSIFGYKKFQLSGKRLLLWLVLIVLLPLWWQHQLYPEALVNMSILSGGWTVYLLVDRKNIKIIMSIVLAILSVFFLLNNAGIISERKIDPSRSFWVDNKNQAELTKFKQMSSFMPFKLKSVVWNSCWQVAETVLRGMSGLGGEKLWPIIGPALWFLAIISLYYRTGWEVGIAIFGIVTTGWLSRNPNTSLIGIYLLPAMVVMSLPAIKKIHLKILVLLVLITLPFIF